MTRNVQETRILWWPRNSRYRPRIFYDVTSRMRIAASSYASEMRAAEYYKNMINQMGKCEARLMFKKLLQVEKQQLEEAKRRYLDIKADISGFHVFDRSSKKPGYVKGKAGYFSLPDIKNTFRFIQVKAPEGEQWVSSIIRTFYGNGIFFCHHFYFYPLMHIIPEKI